ncbi:uncharacterized protein [Henckelia pumila]|uniref:uncharacterized protein n=1 Tax=Henckelia pumila TaxID=405737 RepID=UPI003C6E9B89
MGRHFWTKHVGDEQDHKQPGCISGLINVLDYHHWHSNTRKMIPHNEYAYQTGYWSPKMNLQPHDSCEVEKLLDEEQSPVLKTKRANGNSKRSLKRRMKALIAEEMEKESNNAKTKEGFLFKSRLQRTYSIHHLESLDDSISKICTDWKNPIIFIPSKAENSAPVDVTQTDSNEASGGESESDIFGAADIGSLEKTDFLDILKIDKELFVRNLKSSNGSVAAPFENSKLRKSRSFPDLNFSQRLKFRPSKLADKHKEIWSFRKGVNLQTSSDESDQDSLILKGVVDPTEETTISRIGENTMRNYSHSRSSSLNESLDKYARLFENNCGTDAKLNPSRSLRLTNENGHASMYSRRRRSRSLSHADSFYSNSNLGVTGDHAFGNESFVIAKDDSFRQDVVEEEEKVARLVATEKETLDLFETVECKAEPVEDMQRMHDDSRSNLDDIDESGKEWEDFEEEPHKPKSDDFVGSDPCSISDSQEKLFASEQLKLSEDKFVKSVGHATDSGYVRLILDQSGLAEDASERAWHAPDQPLSPQILDAVEACWPHEHDQLTSWQDFCISCWQHQMLFDLVNETLVETYDVSLPYYPKPLSTSCHVRPFSVGNDIVDEVSTSISKLLNLTTDQEKQSLDHIIVRDLKDDYFRWMNLQFNSECIGLELEDMIFDELVEELVCF